MLARLATVVCMAAIATGCGDGGGAGGSAERPARTITVSLGDERGGLGRTAVVEEDGDGDQPATGRCPGSDLRPPQASADAIEQAVVCLTNAERTDRGLEPLEPNANLAGAARRKARDMARENYFAHVGPDGRDVVDWVRGTGYLPDGGYTLGENIGWAGEGGATPAAIVDAWMESPSHRRNILARDFDDIGVGVVAGVPREGADPGGTYVQMFGSKTPPGV